MPRYFFFGFYRVPMYEWYWGHTAAQIDLINVDSPIICYKRHNEEEDGNGLKPGDKGYKPNKKKLEETVRKWEERKAAREARGFKLGQFLATGDKVPTESESQ